MKVAIPIDVNRLQQEITKAESSNKFTTQSELFQYIANTDWAKKTYRKPLSASVLYARCRDNKLSVTTPKGKRGRVAGVKVTRTSRADKFADNPNFKANIQVLTEHNPNCVKTIERLAGGSMKSAVRLNCLSCCGGDKKSASECNVLSCPLYLFNPFIKTKNSQENNDDE